MPDSDLGTVTVTGSMFSTDEFFLSDYYKQIGPKGYSDITNFVLDTMARQPNYVEVAPSLPAAPPRQDDELEEVVVESTAVPLNELRDDELREIGTDSAFNEIARRQGYSDLEDALSSEFDNESYVAPPVKPDVRQYIDDRTVRRTPAPQNKPFVYRGLPEPPKAPAIPWWGRIPGMSPLLPLLGLLVPLRPGPKIVDEAPEWWDLPDVRGKPLRPPTFTPLPNFLEPELQPFPLPEVPFEPDPFRDPSPRERPELQPLDDPGMLADPAGLPDFPEPRIDFKPRPFPITFPIGDPVVPYLPPFPVEFDYPRTPAEPKPGIPPRPDPFDPTEPDPVSPIDLIPPYFVPTVDVPQVKPDINFPRFDIPLELATPLIPALPPDEAKRDCKCAPCKDKKPKKKKKPAPRSICYEGHYIEHSRGLTKVRGKQVPCDSDTKSARAPRRRAPSLPDLARDVFQLPGV